MKNNPSHYNGYIRARRSQLYFYRNIPLYTTIENQKYVLYKKAGITLGDMRVKEAKHPEKLYIKQSDKLMGIREAQKGLNRQLKKAVISESPDKIKKTLTILVEETLSEPRSGTLEATSETVDILISDFSREKNVVRHLIDLSHKDYSTVLHSINVMAMAISFAYFLNYTRGEVKKLGLCGLLHDVGKTKIDGGLLTAPRNLNRTEFENMKRHTVIGYNILRQCKFNDPDISLIALEHHEKIDGSGYPNNRTRISQTAQIIGLIDCYEALTNDDRPYRQAMMPFDALNQIIKEDVKEGKFDFELYSQFVVSLGNVL